ncbi:TPA: hypothetical protein N0F65_007345 [Lagenidium giganteum]|uniref:BRCT domain-containing protein n=1 Tax=Lagenidium giganteum TaxID=4803 RepID=A0AAV2YGE9_9STRA|nr:TPA: hypothetical protein N0F65_007345 [Lagenidium giganteum]
MAAVPALRGIGVQAGDAFNMSERERVFVGLRISTTGLPVHVKVVEQIRKIVVACGGDFHDDMTSETTHLIADAVGSAKQRAAVEWNIQVATSRWVFDSFRSQELLDCRMYSLRLLEGLVVCTTGLATESREQVERITMLNGGQYEPNMEIGRTQVLIAQRAGGAKHDAALAHGIPVVHLSWIHACVEKGVLLNEEDFALDKVLRPSRLYRQFQADLVALSNQMPKFVQRYHAQQLLRDIKQNEAEENEANDAMIDDTAVDADSASVDWTDLFDVCGLLLVGFPDDTHQQLQSVIRTAMGTIFAEMNVELVTHVVVSPSLQDLRQLDALQSVVLQANADQQVNFVSPRWIVDSVKCHRLEPEELYPVEIDEHHDVGGGADLVAAEEGDQQECSQDFTSGGGRAADDEVARPHPAPNSTVPERASDHSVPAPKRSTPTLSAKQPLIFADGGFLVLCLQPDAPSVRLLVKKLKAAAGAHAIALDHRDVLHIDYSEFFDVTHVVVCSGVALPNAVADQIKQQWTQSQDTRATAGSRPPHTNLPKRLKFVSDLWLRCCLTENFAFSRQAHELFALGSDASHRYRSMFPHALHLGCFEHVRGSVSVYVGVDRVVVMELLRMAGAHVSSKLNRTNTHLICLRPLGMKFEKAREWGIKIVNAQWILQSVVHNQLLDETHDSFVPVDDDEVPNSQSLLPSTDQDMDTTQWG